jgi:DNA polymerase I-like protein with 3'-5' exonuclease and polymerase domains
MWDKGYSPTRDTSVKLILTIHDELVMEATQEKAEYASWLLNRYMPLAGSKVLKHCPVTAEAQIVNNLSEKD